MKLRLKLTLSFLLVSLLTAAAVGATAWWMVTRNFNEAVRERAFHNFQQDVTAYIRRYGSWAAARQAQRFSEFVAQRHAMSGPPRPGPQPPFSQAGQPPFHFLLLTPDGRVTETVGKYVEGHTVPADIRRQGKPITVGGQTVLYAVPVGEAIISPEDRVYLRFMRRALLIGMLVAAAVAILLGIVLSGRHVNRVRELAVALESMRPDGEMPEVVPIRANDEIGLLAATFNRMSRLLIEAHQELQQSNETIRAQAEHMRELSLRDPLTSLYNRRWFDEQANTTFLQAVRYGHSLCVMIADLDHFKSINDNFSHAVGDAVLRRAGALLHANIRSTDLIARYGGEEFAAIFVEASLTQARIRCEQLRRRIEQESWDDIAPGLSVTVSIGLCDDATLGSIEAMMRCADERLYLAKDTGRNRVEPMV